MPETIIVTLQAEGGSCGDFELPSAVRLEELYPRLLAVLKQVNGRCFSHWSSLLLETEAGVLLDLSATLRDYGVCSGCYLTVIQGEDIHGDQ